MATKIKVKLYNSQGMAYDVELVKQTISNRAKIADEDIRTNELSKVLKSEFEDVMKLGKPPREPHKNAPANLVEQYEKEQAEYEELERNFDTDRIAEFQKRTEDFSAMRTVEVLKSMIDYNTVPDAIKQDIEQPFTHQFWSDYQDITELEEAVELFRNKGKKRGQQDSRTV